MRLLIPDMQYLEILKGQALDINIPVVNQDDDSEVDVEFATVAFTLGGESIVTSQSGNIITVPITSAKTLALGASAIAFECWVTITGQSTPVALGRLTIKPSTRT